MPVEIFMDCGAPSLYNKLSRTNNFGNLQGTSLKRRRNDNFSYVQMDDYKTYRQDYVDFILKNQDVLSCYSNLDVINNAELTWKNQRWLEHQGLKPLPVWHYGSDLKWLLMYLEKGYKYICVGGLTPNRAAALMAPLDRIWSDFLCGSDGMPLVKIHGFAMTSFDLMFRYPWYSVDSKSWIDHARFGKILVPMLNGKNWDWRRPERLAVTNRSIHIRHPDKHVKTMSAEKRKRLMKFLDFLGLPLGRSEQKEVGEDYSVKLNETWICKPTKDKKGIVEVPLELGVSNSHIFRMDVNCTVFQQVEQSIPPWPWSLWDQIPRPERRRSLFT